MKDVRPNSAAATLLTRLQAPLARVAMDDLGFFVEKQHPARKMLNTIAEAGSQWLTDDEADRWLVEKMQLLVDRAVSDFDGNPEIFEDLQQDLNGHIQTAVRKAEVAERRHVEAARGQERLALAQQRASEIMAGKLAGKQNTPRFVRTLLSNAWSDVLALTLLRHGEQSELYKRQLDVADRLIAANTAEPTGRPSLSEVSARELENEVVQSLGTVGYHKDDAQAIARKLVCSEDEGDGDDAASRTELTLRMKARARLGQDTAKKSAAGKPTKLNDAERAAMERLKQLPFGAWFEFVQNQQGDTVRRRMSWYSTITGNALFVNHRGQRVGEHSLEWLARAMVNGQVRPVEAEKHSLIDRAWEAIVSTLRSFSGGKDGKAATA